VAISANSNVTQNEAGKKVKYTSLCMWNIKYMIVPIIIGATGRLTKGLQKFGSHTMKTFNRFTITDSSTCNITHNTESTAV
jgi:hypothetical protein